MFVFLFLAKQEKSLEYTILILFKNLESTWIKKKIDQYIKPAIENSKNIVQKTNLSRLIEKITQENVYTSG